MVSNSYLDNLFKNILSSEDEYGYYFYSMSFATIGEYLLFGAFAPLLNKHLIVCFTKKRIILMELDPLTGNVKIELVFENGSSIRFTPNNICIGLSNHKNNLEKINQLYNY